MAIPFYDINYLFLNKFCSYISPLDMVDQCIIDGKLESVQPPLIVAKDPVDWNVVCKDDFDIQEMTVAADGLFRMSNAYHVLLINRIKAAAGV